jgi:hypothetical protein
MKNFFKSKGYCQAGQGRIGRIGAQGGKRGDFLGKGRGPDKNKKSGAVLRRIA